MAPPYTLTKKILSLVAQISTLLGKLKGLNLITPQPKLRKKNHIKTIKSTLAIEGNTFTEEQITAILENKKVIGSKKEILEVKNTIQLYNSIHKYSPTLIKSFLAAHKTLMSGLIEASGKFRGKNVGVLKGKIVKHIAPKPVMVNSLMQDLFDWIKNEKDLHPLVVSSIVHYEIEFIHPFEDGNGRMGRFWQSLLLNKFEPMFKYIPIENIIEKNQSKYYEALEKSDQAGDSSFFIEFMLHTIYYALTEFDSETNRIVVTNIDRLEVAKNYFKRNEFSRKEYMILFKSISSATASRDLKSGVDSKKLSISGDMNRSKYKFI
jgi:Fic family protein